MPSPIAETQFFGPLNERTTALYTATLIDETGAPLPASLLQAATLTFYVPDGPQTIINSRSGQDVLNANGVVIDEDGLVTWTLAPADTAILDATLETEQHIALFHFAWGGNKEAYHEVVFVIRNLSKVP